MRKVAFLALALIGISQPALARDVWVNGYFRSDGVYVPGYWRTAPDSTPYNNYNTYPNVNPYTGRQGTTNPYQVPQYRPYTPPPPIYTPPVYTPPPVYRPYVYTPPCYYNCD